MDQLKAALSEKTVAVLFAHTNGHTYDLEEYADLLRPQGIDIVEDCAQAFQGFYRFRGSPCATMSMFSFGMIKHNTAFNGAVSFVRERQQNASMGLYSSLRAIRDSYRV